MKIFSFDLESLCENYVKISLKLSFLESFLFKFNYRILAHFDYTLPLLVTPIILISWFLINENNEFLGNKVLIYVSAGLLIFAVIFLIPMRKIPWFIIGFYCVNLGFLVLVEFLGTRVWGRKDGLKFH